MRFESQMLPCESMTLIEGLNALDNGTIERLYSDGLESDEYMYCKDGKIYYEDDCCIGSDVDSAHARLSALEWTRVSHFYGVKAEDIHGNSK